MNKSKIIFIVFIVLIVGLGGVSFFFYSKYNASQKLLANPQALVDQQGEKVVAPVAKLMDLPAGETPTVATVLDASKLKEQQFFANAMNEDKVIIFSQAKKAILYRPSTNKIIEVSPLSMGTEAALADPSVTPTPTVKAEKPTPTETPEIVGTEEKL